MHHFLHKPGIWLGQGKITFSETADQLSLVTRWQVSPQEETGLDCCQEVEIEGIPEKMFNSYLISEMTSNSFAIELSNPVLGNVHGKGIIDDQLIAWEFRSPGAFEGFETYTLQPDGSYMMHAEYTSTNQMRTVVHGRIWRSDEIIETEEDEL